MSLRAIGRLRAGAGGQVLPYSTEYTAPGTQTIAIPSGATVVTIEGIGSGSGGSEASAFGGGGGAYSKRNTYSLSGLTGIYIDVPSGGAVSASGADAVARENSVAGTILMLAKGGNGRLGGAAGSGTGDVKQSGGDGATGGTNDCPGGGGAGPDGDGGNAVADGAVGAGNQASWGSGNGGDGGALNNPGDTFGGGGGYSVLDLEGAAGANGTVRLTWAVSAASGLLMETGDNLLLESGDLILLES